MAGTNLVLENKRHKFIFQSALITYFATNYSSILVLNKVTHIQDELYLISDLQSNQKNNISKKNNKVKISYIKLYN